MKIWKHIKALWQPNKQPRTTLRIRIYRCLAKHDVGSPGSIADLISEHPSDVRKELNAMKLEGVVQYDGKTGLYTNAN